MVTRSKLRLAIAAEKGIDFKKLKLERKRKEAFKRKRAKEALVSAACPAVKGPQKERVENDDKDEMEHGGEEGGEDWEDDQDDEQDEQDEQDPAANTMNLDAVDESDTSDSSVEFETNLVHKTPKPKAMSKKSTRAARDYDDDDDEEIPVSDLDDIAAEDKEDLVPHTRLTINNTSALQAALDRIALPTRPSDPFAPHQSIVSATPTAAAIPDVADDLAREVAFYSQCLDAVQLARVLLAKEGLPFSRPGDYFAEMVKDDAHMEKVKGNLVEEAAAKKAAAEARRQRDLKKFGKQVQVAKLQERQKAKRETLDKIKTLKRKRQESGTQLSTNEADQFDVGVDAELAKHSTSHKPNAKRQKKNEKYGFGGRKRHAKSGNALSSGDLSAFSHSNMRAGRVGGAKKQKSKANAPRPGKSRRRAIAKR